MCFSNSIDHSFLFHSHVLQSSLATRTTATNLWEKDLFIGHRTKFDAIIKINPIAKNKLMSAHFFAFHSDKPHTVDGVFFEHWFAFDEPLKLIDTRTFVLNTGDKVRSYIPLTFYHAPTSDADTPAGSMRIVPHARIVNLLLKTGVYRNCLQTLPMPMLEIVQPFQ